MCSIMQLQELFEDLGEIVLGICLYRVYSIYSQMPKSNFNFQPGFGSNFFRSLHSIKWPIILRIPKRGPPRCCGDSLVHKVAWGHKPQKIYTILQTIPIVTLTLGHQNMCHILPQTFVTSFPKQTFRKRFESIQFVPQVLRPYRWNWLSIPKLMGSFRMPPWLLWRFAVVKKSHSWIWQSQWMLCWKVNELKWKNLAVLAWAPFA